MTTSTPPNHYSILNIPYPPSHPLLKQDVKLAYHRALLKHHPDKSGPRSSRNPAKTPPTSTGTRTNSTHKGTNSDSPWLNDGETMATPNIATEALAPAPAPAPAEADKTMQLLPSEPPLGYTIDQIATAYKILSDPVTRAEYDRSLRLSGINDSRHGPGHGGDDGMHFRTGMEIFDLDDMEIGAGGDDSRDGAWYHSCRCGEERGFLVLEEDLEREAERGEVVVGCRGCSLWATVVFAIDEGGEDGVENDRIS
ncbi:hypothetical protein ACJ72_05431 [Emergomyces africanus]|uniref:Diphthamide biosynthesis protein 4 n=1 Tax=Emergomyces africanus TaxID=1955775 RepID=A0A1B7NTY4_9EURO|nr:hypothetical protein ACJ72_05431 [Emergomyces africanus]